MKYKDVTFKINIDLQEKIEEIEKQIEDAEKLEEKKEKIEKICSFLSAVAILIIVAIITLITYIYTENIGYVGLEFIIFLLYIVYADLYVRESFITDHLYKRYFKNEYNKEQKLLQNTESNFLEGAIHRLKYRLDHFQNFFKIIQLSQENIMKRKIKFSEGESTINIDLMFKLMFPVQETGDVSFDTIDLQVTFYKKYVKYNTKIDIPQIIIDNEKETLVLPYCICEENGFS